jgi:hypothetical protein
MADSCEILDEISERAADEVSRAKSKGKKVNIAAPARSNGVSRYRVDRRLRGKGGRTD